MRSKCEMAYPAESFECMDQYVVGYSDALCFNDTCQSGFRCICHKRHTVENTNTTIVIAQQCQFYHFEENSEEVTEFKCDQKLPTSVLPMRDENVALCNGLSGQVDCTGQVSLGISDAECRVIGCRHRMLITTRCLCHKFINNQYIPSDCELFYLMDETPIPRNLDLCTGQVIPAIPTKLDLLSPIDQCHMVPDPENGQWRCDETSCQLFCNDGYWAPNRVFDCFCSSSDPDKCSWSAAKKIQEMKCQPALCPDLQTDETKGWSCSGRAKYDLCWAPCHVGLMVKYTEAKCKCRKGQCQWDFSSHCSQKIPLDYLRMAIEFTADIIPRISAETMFESSGDN